MLQPWFEVCRLARLITMAELLWPSLTESTTMLSDGVPIVCSQYWYCDAYRQKVLNIVSVLSYLSSVLTMLLSPKVDV